jgi:hypothetical protein
MTKLEKKLLKELKRAVEQIEWSGCPDGYSGAEYQKYILEPYLKVIKDAERRKKNRE